MNKSGLSAESLEKIDFAMANGLGTNYWQPISLLNGSRTGIPLYKIRVKDKLYAIKVENTQNKIFHLTRSYKILNHEKTT